MGTETMAHRYAVIWFNAKGDEYRGSGADLNSAKWLLHSAIPRDAVRGIVKLGNKIVFRSDLAGFAESAEAAA
jgi:hypothetical protein